MTDHPKLKDKIKDFDLSKLRRLNFGKLEGEKDPILHYVLFTTLLWCSWSDKSLKNS